MADPIETVIKLKLEDLLSSALERSKRSIGDLGNEIKGAGEKAKTSGGLFDGMLGNLAKIGLGVTGFLALKDAGQRVASTLFSAATATATHAKETEKLRRELGVTSEEASKLSYIGQRLNLDTQDLSLSFGKFSKFIVESSDKLAEHDITVVRTRDGHVDFEKTLGAVADRFTAMPDGVEKSALAMELFGKTGKDMIPLLNKGRDGLKDMGDEASRMGLVLDDKALAAAKRYRESLKTLQETKEALINKISQAFMPALASAAGGLASLASEKVPVLLARFDELKEKITGALAPAFSGLASAAGDAFRGALATIGHGVGGIGEIFDVLTKKRPDAGGELRAAIGDELAVAVMGAVAGVRDRAEGAWKELDELFGKIWEVAKPKLEAFVGKLDELRDRFEGLPEPLKKWVEAVGIAAVATKATGLDDTLISLFSAVGNFAQGVFAAVGVLKGASLSGILSGIALAARAALLALAGFALPALAIAGIITGIVFIATHTRELGEAWDALSGIVGVVAGFVGRKIGDLFDFIGTKIHDFFEPFGKLLDLFGKNAPYALGILVGAVIRSTGEMWSAIGTFIHNWFEGMGRLKDFVLAKFGELKDGAVDAVKSLAKGAWDALSHFVTHDIPQFLGDLKDKLLGTGGEKGVKELAADAVAGFVAGILGAIPDMIESAKKAAGDFIQGVKDAFGIQSPSTVMADVGVDIAAGLAQGVESGTGLLGAAAAKLVTSMTASLRDQIAALLKAVPNTAQILPTVTLVGRGPGLTAVPNVPGFGPVNAPVGAVLQKIGDTIISLSEAAIGRSGIPSRQHGGDIPTEGLYYLHAGEEVLTAAQRRGRGGVVFERGALVVNGPVDSRQRVEALADAIGDVFAQRMRLAGSKVTAR